MAIAASPTNFRTAMDTPTRAPSSLGRASSILITSLKPQRSFTQNHSRTSSVDKSKSHAAQAPVQSRKVLGGYNGGGWPMAQQHNTDDIANLELELDNDLTLDQIEIATDGSERARRTLEEEIRRGMDMLRSGARDEERSVGFGGDISDADEQHTYGGNGAGTRYESDNDRFRARIEDESDSNGSRESQQAANKLPTTNNNHQQHTERGAQVSSDDDELTYIDINRSPTSPPQQQQPAKAATSLSGLTRATLASFGARPNENARPASFSPARSQPAAAQPSNRPSAYRPSPLSTHMRPSPSLGPFPASTAATSLPRAPAARAAKSGGVSFNTKVNSWSSQHHINETETETEGEQEYSNRMRLPDVTGLTEGLQSPIKARGHTALAAPASTTTSTEGALLSSALGSMRAKLAQLERENARSDARVRELEAKLAKDKAHAQAAAAGNPVRLAAPAVTRPSALEADVRALRSQVQQLAHSLHAQAENLASLHQPAAPSREFASAESVDQIRIGLDRLTTEVDGVKVIVESLLTDRDQRDRIAAWDREERARRQAMDLDDDRTPRPAEKRPLRTSALRRSVPREEAPTPGRSFLGDEEVRRLRDEIMSPSPRARKSTRPASVNSHSAHMHNSYSTSAASVTEASTTAEEDDAEEEAEVERSFRRARDIFRSVSTPADGIHRQHGGKNGVCSMCARPFADATNNDLPRSAPAKATQWEAPVAATTQTHSHSHRHRSTREKAEKTKSSSRKHSKEPAPAPVPAAIAQETLFKVLFDLEADFSTHKRLYVELSEQYRLMDAKVSGARRRALAEHLKQSVDVLETKADQVRKLHQLLHPRPRRA